MPSFLKPLLHAHLLAHAEGSLHCEPPPVCYWAAANGGVTNGGLRGVWPPCLEIGRNQPKSPFFCLFRPFPEGAKSTWEIKKTEEIGLFPQISSDFLKPPSLKPPFAALQCYRSLSGPSGPECPRKQGVSEGVSGRVSPGSFGPQALECPKSVPSESVPRVFRAPFWHSGDAFGTLFGHSVGHSRFRGHSRGHTRARRARETRVAGRRDRNHGRTFSANFCKNSAKFLQKFRTLSWRNKTYFSEFLQNFRKETLR